LQVVVRMAVVMVVMVEVEQRQLVKVEVVVLGSWVMEVAMGLA
jgi:hypothetical protein